MDKDIPYNVLWQCMCMQIIKSASTCSHTPVAKVGSYSKPFITTFGATLSALASYNENEWKWLGHVKYLVTLLTINNSS